jgi:hypothetical protein
MEDLEKDFFIRLYINPSRKGTASPVIQEVQNENE